MPTPTAIAGAYAAVLVPRNSQGTLDETAFRATLDFLVARDLNRVVVNGATGEYCLTSLDEFRRMARICRETLGPTGEFLAGIGSAGLHATLALAAAAQDEGAAALLLPMPHFFPYAQTDLSAWCREVAGRTPLPVLLYNLPSFTSPLEAATVRQLVLESPNIVGIKDSSGSLEILSALAPPARRIVGHDGALVTALTRDVCDGVISGVAGVLPELILPLWNRRACLDQPDYRQTAARLDELIVQLSALPVPWALKWLAEARGIAPAVFSQPLSSERSRQGDALVRWFREWWPSV